MTEDNDIPMRKSRLTCVSIEPIGQINAKHGNLIRYLVRFQEGIEGEYWAQSESSKKNFPLHEIRGYKYTPLSKKGMADTWKFQPCKKSEIPEIWDPLPPLDVPLKVTTPASPTTTTLTPDPEATRTPAPVSPPPIHLEAFRSSIRLAMTGRIAVDQIGVTAHELKRVITGLSKES